jgi:hypothetical protein
VIAYRGKQTPAQGFRIFDLKNAIKKNKERLEEIKKEQTELVRALASNPTPPSSSIIGERDADQLNAAQLEANNPLYNGDGLAQNLLGITNALSSDLQAGVSQNTQEAKALNETTARYETELSELSKIQFFPLGSLHTISYSSFRENFAVRTLGKVQAKGYTQGPRTVAGTMIFNTLQEHELYKLHQLNSDENLKGSHPKARMLDQIKPFNVLLLFANEYGAYSTLHLFDVLIGTEGQTMSIDQVVTQNSMNFYATEMLPMRAIGNAYKTFSNMLEQEIESAQSEQKGSDSSPSNATFNIDTQITNPFAENADEINIMLRESRGLF